MSWAEIERSVSSICVRTFSNAVAYYDGSAEPIDCVFDDNYLTVGEDDGIGVASSGPFASCNTSDLPGIAQGKAIVIDAVNYIIRGFEPDSKGMTVLKLEKQ